MVRGSNVVKGQFHNKAAQSEKIKHRETLKGLLCVETTCHIVLDKEEKDKIVPFFCPSLFISKYGNLML